MTDKNYQVGYGKPPRSHCFQKGQCANPKGRGYKAKPGPAEQFVQVHTEKMPVNGKAKRMKVSEVVILQLSLAALAGRLDPLENLLDLHARSKADKAAVVKRIRASNARVAEVLDRFDRLLEKYRP